MKLADLLIAYAKDHTKKQIAWFASSLFGTDAKYPAKDGGGNPYHDPETGRFTTGGNGGSGSSEGSEKNSVLSSIFTPAKKESGKHQKVSPKDNQSALKKHRHDVAKECLRKAERYKGEPEVREAYQMWAHNMSTALTGRPSEEDSKKLMEKNLKNISSQLKPYAQQKYRDILKDEHKITSDLCDISDEIGTGMFGLDFRMKSAGEKTVDGKKVCRIAEKIEENQREAQREGRNDSYENAVNSISDIVRYTQACTPDNLVDNAEKTMQELEKKGYKVVKVKNTWETFNEEKPYRGLNCVFESPNGTKFELQFHTAESLVAKEVQHGWYEESRTKGVNPSRKAELDKRMYENMASMTVPKDIGRIKSYPPKDDKEKKK